MNKTKVFYVGYIRGRRYIKILAKNFSARETNIKCIRADFHNKNIGRNKKYGADADVKEKN